MKITYYGHSSFGIESNGTQLLFDPFITPNALASEISIKDIECDYLLISHAHEDHVADVELIANQCNSTIVSNYEIISYFKNKGCNKTHPMNIGGSWIFDFGKLKLVNAVHSSGFADGQNGGNPGGFIIEMEGKRVYYAGDTALHSDMKLIREYWKPDLAFLPIGDNFTMSIDDAILACEFIGCDNIIGMHYDTFPYIKIDHDLAKNKFKKAGKNLTLMGIGASMNF